MYENETPDIIKKRILSNISSMSTMEGSFADDMAGPMAVELSKLYSSLNAVRYMVWVDETSGIYLDMAAEDLGIEPRKEAAKAKAELVLTGEAGYVIPVGSSFYTGDGLYYLTDAEVKLPDSGSAKVSATAEEGGSAYNTQAETILYFAVKDDRLKTVSNPAAAEGGTDTESDASLYSRIAAYRQRPSTSGNEAHYEQWALEVPGVGAAKVQGLWDGPGTVKVLIADEENQPVSESIRESCEAHILSLCPVGAGVTVSSAEPLTVDVEAALTLKSGADIEAVKVKFEAALSSHFKLISLEQPVLYYNRVGTLLMNIEEVVNFKGLMLNGATEDLTFEADQVPVMGRIDLS